MPDEGHEDNVPLVSLSLTAAPVWTRGRVLVSLLLAAFAGAIIAAAIGLGFVVSGETIGGGTTGTGGEKTSKPDSTPKSPSRVAVDDPSTTGESQPPPTEPTGIVPDGADDMDHVHQSNPQAERPNSDNNSFNPEAIVDSEAEAAQARRACAPFKDIRAWATEEQLISACNEHCPVACNRAARRLRQDNRDPGPDPKAARMVLRKGCGPQGRSERSAWSCTQLGVLLKNGAEGVTRVAHDRVEAVRLFTFACNAGEAIACSNLAHMTRNRLGGLTGGRKKARTFLRKACDLGRQQDCEQLWSQLQKFDVRQASKLAESACDQHGLLCYKLGPQ